MWKAPPAALIKQQQIERAQFRFFPVEVPAGRALGVGVRKTTPGALAGAVVRELAPQGSGAFVREWNLRCAQTFPDDAIQIGDVIVRANWAVSYDSILEVLRAQGEPRLLVLARWVGSSSAKAMAPSVEAPGIGALAGDAAADFPELPRRPCSPVSVLLELPPRPPPSWSPTSADDLALLQELQYCFPRAVARHPSLPAPSPAAAEADLLFAESPPVLPQDDADTGLP